MITDEQLRYFINAVTKENVTFVDEETVGYVKEKDQAELYEELLQLRNQVRVQIVAAALTGVMATDSKYLICPHDRAKRAVALADATLAAMGRKA